MHPGTLPHRHNETGEDNAAAQLRSSRSATVDGPITAGKLDLGPWHRCFTESVTASEEEV